MIVDFSRLNPKGWVYDKRPDTIKHITDYILYETHIKDLTTHELWGGPKELVGTFLGLTVSNTKYTSGNKTVKTGLDHLVELGINAVHLLPVHDSDTTDETRLKDEAYMKQNGYNWGYMTKNFNVLEGAYSKNPFDGSVKVGEFKELIMAMHEKGLRVVLDVVYNHTYQTEGSHFQIQAPDYFYRIDSTGAYSNGSGTGNETASERFMYRKYMIDSIFFRVKEYNISGFRFDLMGLHDVETMNEIRKAVNKVDPTIIIYGEPWWAAQPQLPHHKQAVTANMYQMTQVASFNDRSREAFKKYSVGETNGEISSSVKYALTGASEKLNDYMSAHKEPYRLINYVTAHDNSTLRDEYFRFYNVKDAASLERLSRQANGLVFTSQGIPFIQGGTEMMLSKKVPDWVIYSDDNRVDSNGLSDNSYNLPEEVNQFNYQDKIKHENLFNYYKHLITIRREFDHLRMSSKDEIDYRFEMHHADDKTFMYKIKGLSGGPEMILIHTSSSPANYTFNKDYYILSDGANSNIYGVGEIKQGNNISIPAYATYIAIENHPNILYSPGHQGIDYSSIYGIKFDRPVEVIETPKTNSAWIYIVIITSVLIIGGIVAVKLLMVHKKQPN